MNITDLQSTYSDLHKDFYGYRPRLENIDNWEDAEWLQGRIDQIFLSLDALQQTSTGRDWLQANGWQVNS